MEYKVDVATFFSPTTTGSVDKSVNTFQVDLRDQRIHQVFDGFLEILLNLLAHRDYTTYLHSLRVAELARRIGIFLQLAEEEVLTLEHGGLIHDIGQLSIPDDVLLKPSRFSIQDRYIMDSHPLIGAQLFSGKGLDEALIEIVLRHHERLDGSGYPDGLSGPDISLYTRVVAVADVYEALIARRPYKRKLSRNGALEILALDVREGKLDGEIVRGLDQVTQDWDPLSICGKTVPEALTRLENFRSSSYFREPLSQFYSYRYLLALEESHQFLYDGTCYDLFALSFRHLRNLNRDKGYIETDRIIITIGEQLQKRVAAIVDKDPQLLLPSPLFLKKGADYIIYCRHDADRCRALLQLIEESIAAAKSCWGIECVCYKRIFMPGTPFSDALDLLFTGDDKYA